MDCVKYGYSTKCIPLASPQFYQIKLLEKTQLFLNKVRWKTYFFLNPNARANHKETFGFKSNRQAPTIELLKDFESKMFSLVKSVQFNTYHNSLQQTLKQDVKNINSDRKLIIPADKTSNFYRIEPQAYANLLHSHVTKDYKKAGPTVRKSIIAKDTKIADKLELSDRIEATAEKEVFLTIKDHKDSFPNRVQCRVINPAKPELGHISKQILDRINKQILSNASLNQWKSTQAVLNWFSNIQFQPNHSFLTFDIVDFYPSISQELLDKALDFASGFATITDSEKDIIMHTKKSLLYYNKEPWCKKNNPELFDVAMGAWDGAEACELVGTYLLSSLAPLCDGHIGLYRDDGLAITTKPPQQAERIKKEICKVFRNHGLRITISANKKVVDFLDVTLNLNDGSFKPYMKPNNSLAYVHVHSNHPPTILKNIPKSINNRLNRISSNEHLFNLSVPPFRAALQQSGYEHNLTYSPNPTTNPTRRNRKRKILWYNPPYSANVQTNIGNRFLKIIDQCFKPNHPLRKILNKNTIKLSYSCLPNMDQIIHNHNRNIVKAETRPDNQARMCNCRGSRPCPLDGQCLTEGVVYQATVAAADNRRPETYVGVTELPFKTRYNIHKNTFAHARYKNNTELSKYIHSLGDIQYNIKWRILKKCNPYSNFTKKCNLCSYEKYIIVYKPNLCSLNKRNEIMSICKHRKKFTLAEYKNR